MNIKHLGYIVVAVLVSGFTEALIFEQSSATAQTSGCGSGKSWYLLRVMTPISAKQFEVACNEHDACYDTYGKSKEECDKAFHNRMLGICARDHNTIVGRPLRIACNGRADAFYTAVLEYGMDSYNQGQAAAKPAPSQALQQQGVDLYRNILGRDPEPGAAEGLASRLANGSTLARERQVMANSDESRNNAVNLYRTILGRDPEPGAAEGIVSRLANNSTLARERQVMANSEESRNNLANLYRTILGREPEPGAVDGLVSRLANGSSLAQEREIMTNSEEAKKRRGL